MAKIFFTIGRALAIVPAYGTELLELILALTETDNSHSTCALGG